MISLKMTQPILMSDFIRIFTCDFDHNYFQMEILTRKQTELVMDVPQLE